VVSINAQNLSSALNAYHQRTECMFRDCKTGGNLEGCHACKRRLSTIVLLIALAYTCAIIQGIDIRMSKVERYICRPKSKREFNAVIAISGWFIRSILAE